METLAAGPTHPGKGHLQNFTRRKRLRTESHGWRPVPAFTQRRSERGPRNHLSVQGPLNIANLGTNQLSPCSDHVLEHSPSNMGKCTT